MTNVVHRVALTKDHARPPPTHPPEILMTISTPRPHRYSRYALLHLSLSASIELDHLNDGMEIICAAIKRSTDHLASLPRASVSEEEGAWMDAVEDSESETVERLVGIGFLLCQRFITVVVTRTMHLRAMHVLEGLTAPIGAEKLDILRFHRTHGKKKQYSPIESPIEVVDAFANYFKHGEEWGVDWEGAKNTLAEKTSAAIRQAGAEPGSSGNFRRGAKSLGITDYADLMKLSSILDAWAKDIIAAFN